MKKRLQHVAAVFLLLFSQLAAGLAVAPARVLADDPYTVATYDVPTADAGPHGLVTGPDGALWFTETGGNKIGRIAPGGAITEYAVPTVDSRPQALTVGPDGALWFVELFGNKIGRITTAGAITEFTLPASNTFPSRLAVGSDGQLWFSVRSRINNVDGYSMMKMTTSGTFTRYQLTPYDITVSVTDVQTGMDGMIWFAINHQTSGTCATKNNWIGRMTPTGAVTYYQLPTRCNGPLRLTQGFDGAWWFTQAPTQTGERYIGRVAPPNTNVTDYLIPTPDSNAVELTTGPDGAVWFSQNSSSKLGRITHHGVMTEHAVPSFRPSAITSGPDGNLWFADSSNNKVVRFTLPAEVPFSGDLVYTTIGSNVEMVDLDSNAAPTVLATKPGSQFYRHITVNPAGTRIYYDSNLTATPVNQLRPGINVEGTAALRCETPSASPDGKRLACYDIVNGERAMKVVSLADHRETFISVPGVNGASGSPILQPRMDWVTNSSLLFAMTDVGCSAPYLARINVDGTGFTTLTPKTCSGLGAVEGRVSNSGSKIVYYNNDGLYMMNVDGSNPTLLKASTPTVMLTVPAWSKDDRYLSVTESNPTMPGQNTRLLIIDAQTGAVVKAYLQQGFKAFGWSDWIGTYTPPDSIAPTVTGTPDRQPNTAGWYDNDVTITWASTDPEPSSGEPTTPSPTLADQEGTHQYASAQSCDPANNCATGNVTVSIDKTNPTIGYSLSQAPNAAGWHDGDVVVTFDCEDAVSGIVSCTEPINVGEGANQTVSGTAVDLAGREASITVTLNVDKTKPTIAYSTSPASPNAVGWFTSDVTVSFQCLDNLSGVESCSPPVSFAQEGEGQVATGTAADMAGNEQSIIVTVNIDRSAPGLGTPNWTFNPKSVAQSSDLSVVAADTVSGVTRGEYFLGDIDPGQGNGTAMGWNGTALTSTFGTNLPPGVYKVNVRAQDEAGNWSAISTDYLVVYDPLGFSITGRRTIVPTLAGGDVLPGLVASSQDDKAKFAFNVKYNNQGVIANNSDLMFDYSTGTKCNNPNQAENCHHLKLTSTNIEWLVVSGTNNSQGIFQGEATLVVDGVTTTNRFRVTGLDGTRLGPTADDHFLFKIYAPGADPNVATPLYQVSQDVLRGNIRIRE